MNHNRVIELTDKAGGIFRLAVLLQKRVRELVNGAPSLVETDEEDPIDIALLEIEADAIELVDLSEKEMEQLEAASQSASEEAELLEALRNRMIQGVVSPAEAAPPKKEAAPPKKEDDSTDA